MLPFTLRSAALAAALLLSAQAAALAQQPAPRPQQPQQPQQPPPGAPMPPQMDMPGRMGMTPEQREQRMARMRAQIEERFGQRVQAELGLNDAQMERLRAASRANEDRQRDIGRREQDLRRALGQQLQPGVAASADSVGKLLDAIAANHVARAQLEQVHLRDLSQFLTPVQRARLIVMWRHFMDRVEEIRERGMDHMEGMRGRPGGPGMMGRRRPAAPPPEFEL